MRSGEILFYKKFGIEKNMIVGITGSGGKTSLMFLLAEELCQNGRVLVTTTTKIFEPCKNQYENLFLCEEKKILKGTGKNIDILGLKIENGKLISPDEKEIMKLKSQYDYVIYEGDGSKQKLMKYWKPYEPCILSFTDIVIGVGNIKALGLPFNEENVHRFNMYMNDNKKNTHKNIDEGILKDYLKNGKFFRNFAEDKRRIIFLNGIETTEELSTAFKFFKEIPDFMFGSVREKTIYTPENISAVVMGSGESKRFGQNKLLYEINGIPMIEILLRKLVSIPFKNIFVTYKDEEVLEICRKYSVTPLKNEKYFLGQSESIKLGTKETEEENIMFFTGDMPFLSEKTIMRIIGESFLDDNITVPCAEGQRFSPVIFPNRYKNMLMNLSGDRGGREIIKQEKKINFVEFKSREEFIDIDTKEELKNKGETNV